MTTLKKIENEIAIKEMLKEMDKVKKVEKKLHKKAFPTAKEKRLGTALNKMFVNREKNCPTCKNSDTYLTNLREGCKYRCNHCGRYFK